jgi:hypothetical protein
LAELSVSAGVEASVQAQDIGLAAVSGGVGFGAVDYAQFSISAELVDATIEAALIENTSAEVAYQTIEMQRVA